MGGTPPPKTPKPAPGGQIPPQTPGRGWHWGGDTGADLPLPRGCGAPPPDPHHRELYLNSKRLPRPPQRRAAAPQRSEWKRNLLRIQSLVLIGGPDDGVITPWQSSLFGFYDANETVQEMRAQAVYLQDTFGLKTLEARGDLGGCTVPGVGHTAWHSNRSVYEHCIRPWLT
ncbi:lysosomal thioesterase PPT2 [Buteo buteo]|uniref:lysosomal thioesterase PPT2 n=1 Tax=Buteo buteo TaxID=30397 RepID=UPI003EBB93C2